MAIHCHFFQLCLFGNSHNKMLEKETGVVFRDVVTLSFVVHKEFGRNPKMDRKPLKDFDGWGDRIRFVFSKLSLAILQSGGVIGLGRK